jgi:predicted dehydrogenase
MTPSDSPYRAAIIGHTGRGNYGHGLDIVFTGLPKVEVIAVADPDEAGRKRAQDRSGAVTGYADYHEMLERERPNLVSIAPRYLGERLDMVKAAAAVGAHIYLEKPMATCLAEADAMLDACTAAGVKMAVAHQGRLHPATLHMLDLVRQGEIGTLRLIRGYGKLDHRGGGEDLMVLGTHIFDLMRLFAGDASWVSADLLSGSRLAGPDDVRQGGDEVGPIAGDGLQATIGFEHGVIGMFESFANLSGGEALLGLDLVGEEGQLSLVTELLYKYRLYKYPYAYAVPGAPLDRWEQVLVPNAAPGEVSGTEAPAGVDLEQAANRRIVVDLLAAVEEDREPLGSGQRARSSLELIQAVAAAHTAGGRIALPLQERGHPLGR